MSVEASILRLIYPQEVGGWIPMRGKTIETESKKYNIGVELLSAIMPDNRGKTVVIPMTSEDETLNVVGSYDFVLSQVKYASDAVFQHKPDKIITLTGDTSASVVPLGYLSSTHPGDMAVVWIDGNPDVTIPATMATMAWLGKRLESFVHLWPRMIPASKLLIVGYRSWSESLKEWQSDLGMMGVSPRNVTENNSAKVLEWIKATGVKKVFVHFNMDVLDPSEIMSSNSPERNGMKMSDVIMLINDIAAKYDLVGLTVVEPLPRTIRKIHDLLSNLPLFSERE